MQAAPEIDEGPPIVPTLSPGGVQHAPEIDEGPTLYPPLALEVCSLPLRLMRSTPCYTLFPWRCAACP